MQEQFQNQISKSQKDDIDHNRSILFNEQQKLFILYTKDKRSDTNVFNILYIRDYIIDNSFKIISNSP